MTQYMNKTLKALCTEIYETEGLADVRDLSKEIAVWIAETVTNEKYAQAEAKRNGLLGTTQSKASKGWHKLFGKVEKCHEKFAKKVATQLKALVTLKKKAVAKAQRENKPSKIDKAMSTRWSKVLTKYRKKGESDTKKAIAQLKKLKIAQVKANGKTSKKAKVVANVAVGDDLIASLLAKANKPKDPKPEEAIAPHSIDSGELEQEVVLGSGEQEEEEEVAVSRFEHNGVKYLKDAEGYLFDPETNVEVAFWDENQQAVVELDDDDEPGCSDGAVMAE